MAARGRCDKGSVGARSRRTQGVWGRAPQPPEAKPGDFFPRTPLEGLKNDEIKVDSHDIECVICIIFVVAGWNTAGHCV